MKTLATGGGGTFIDGPDLELGSHLCDREKYVVWVWCATEDCPSRGQWVTIDGRRGLVANVHRVDSTADMYLYWVEIWVIHEVDVGSVTSKFPVYSKPQIERGKRMLKHDNPCPLADLDETRAAIDCTYPPIKISLFSEM
mgnify:CR=1 FL=1